MSGTGCGGAVTCPLRGPGRSELQAVDAARCHGYDASSSARENTHGSLSDAVRVRDHDSADHTLHASARIIACHLVSVIISIKLTGSRSRLTTSEPKNARIKGGTLVTGTHLV
ncbi:hypothetical protein CEXT_607871 [Caerostris extrusa]|uniref:Uncharacterized protein n=1 Tax=Caerostris extrusa TaxID=172846 RepID=A0AAV4MVZ2_CAEEX|nr:hypothetical protein CEXT_607871 [Caerostris extrusa]